MKKNSNERNYISDSISAEQTDNMKKELITSEKIIFITKSMSHNLPGIIVEANDKASELLGYSKNILCSMSFYDLIDIKDVGILETKSKKLTEKEYIDYILNVYTQDNKKIRLFLESFLISSNGEIVELIIAEEETEKLKRENYGIIAEVKPIDFSFLQNSGVATAIVNQNMSILKANSEFLRISGYNYQQLKLLTLNDLLGKDFFGSKYEGPIFDVENLNNFPLTVKSVLIDKNNNHRYIQLNIGIIEGCNDFIITVSDITDQSILQTALLKSEEKYRQLFNNSLDIIILHKLETDPSPTLTILDVNEIAEKKLGYSKDELIGNVAPRVSIMEKDFFENLLNTLLENNQFKGELAVQGKDGTKIPLEMNSIIFELEGEKVVLTSGRDITERKEMEEAIRRSEKKFRELFQKANDMNFLYPLSESGDRGNFVEVNKLACEKLGYTREELLSLNLSNIVKESSEGQLNEFAVEILGYLKGESVNGTSYLPHGQGNLITKTNDVIPVEYTTTVFEQENEHMILAVVRDISEKLEAERALRGSEEKYSSVVESSNDGIAISQVGKLVFANKQLAVMLDYSLEDLLELEATEVISPKDRNTVSDISERRLAGDTTIPNKYEVDLITSKGIDLPVEVNAVVIDYKGKPASVSIIRDITERKEAQRALYASENKYRSLFEGLVDAVFVGDPETRKIVDCNLQAEKLTGFTKEEILTLRVDDFLPQDVIEESMNNFEKFTEGSRVFAETVILTKDEKRIPVSIKTYSTELKDKQFLIGIVSDITEQEESKQALKESNEKYKQIFDNALDSIIVATRNLTTGEINFIEVNDEACDTFEYSKEEFQKLKPSDLFPEESYGVMKEIQDRLKENKNSKGDVVILTKSGKKIPMEFSSNPVKHENIVTSIHVARNLSEKKEAEKTIKESETKYSHLFDNALDMILVAERIPGTNSLVFVDVNKKAIEKYGYTKEEFLQLETSATVAEENLAKFEEIKEDNLLKKSVIGELLTKTKTGKRILVEFNSNRVQIGDKEYSFTISRDISEKREMEKALEEREK